MDTNTLRTFITVAQLKSFSLAANKLQVTQPAVSKRIATLEAELHSQLFDRIGRNIVLTAAGQLFSQRAQIILRALEDSATDIANLSGKIDGNLTIATSHHIGLHRMPPTLKKFNQTYPEVDLQLSFLDSESACKEVLIGDFELAVVTLPFNTIENLNSKTIWKDNLSIVIANEHPQQQLLKKQNSNETLLKHLSELPAILPQKGTYTRQIIEQQFHLQQLSINVRLSTNYLETIKMLVRVGLGWSILPNSMIDDANEITVINTNDQSLQRDLGVVWHAKRTRSNAAVKMIELIESFGDL